MIKIEKWSEFKQILDGDSINPQYIELADQYYIVAQKGSLKFEHVLLKKTPMSSEQTDFENNYKPNTEVQLGPQTQLKGVGLAGDRLKVDTVVSQSPSDTPGCPVLSCNSKTVVSDTEIDLPMSSQSYTDVISITGDGKLVSFLLDFDSDKVKVRLEIDSKEILEIDCAILDDIFTGNDDGAIVNQCGWIHWCSSKNRLVIEPECPWAYSTSFKIQVKANGEYTNKDLEKHIVCYTKEN